MGGDPTRFALMGDSAGGNIAAVLAQRCAREGGPSPALQVLVLEFYAKQVAVVGDDIGKHVSGARQSLVNIRDMQNSYREFSERSSGNDEIAMPTITGIKRFTIPRQYSTSTRYNPRAGAVAPAADRLRACRMRVISCTCRVPLPIRMNVPTRLRTMWCKNPDPRTV